jgi:hypothetical protein
MPSLCDPSRDGSLVSLRSSPFESELKAAFTLVIIVPARPVETELELAFVDAVDLADDANVACVGASVVVLCVHRAMYEVIANTHFISNVCLLRSVRVLVAGYAHGHLLGSRGSHASR